MSKLPPRFELFPQSLVFLDFISKTFQRSEEGVFERERISFLQSCYLAVGTSKLHQRVP